MRNLVIIAALLPACGGYTDSGDGSKTLRVEADIVYLAGGANAIFAEVRVTKNGDAVHDAKVTLTDGDTDEVINLDENGGSGNYDGGTDGYHRRLALEVKHSKDELNAKLEGPGDHTILDPKNNETTSQDDIGDHLEVKWSVKDGIAADEVRIAIDGDHPYNTDDSGQFGDIPGSKIDKGSRTVSVARTNRVSLKGGTSGSEMTLSYVAANDFIVE
jgi:hypothetical protein